MIHTNSHSGLIFKLLLLENLPSPGFKMHFELVIGQAPYFVTYRMVRLSLSQMVPTFLTNTSVLQPGLSPHQTLLNGLKVETQLKMLFTPTAGKIGIAACLEGIHLGDLNLRPDI